jgi:serine/threonine-protein kinase
VSHAPESGTSPYLNPGHVLGERYEIEREIGRGGYSVVYLARDRELGTGVAVKLLVPPPALAKLARERMRREAIAARGLAHPNIVGLHDFLEDGPWSYLVMEYVDGPDLRERVDTRGPLSPDEVVRIGADVAAALDAAHRQGILHRDVKPQNVLLAPDGRARLTDFGSARLESQATGDGRAASRRTLGRVLARAHPVLRPDGRASRWVRATSASGERRRRTSGPKREAAGAAVAG